MDATRTIGDIAGAIEALTGGELPARLIGDAGRRVERVGTLESAGPDELSFFANARYRQAALATRAGVLVLSARDQQALFPDARADGVLVVCDAPYVWFAYAAQQLDAGAGMPPAAGVHPSAVVSAGARVDAGAAVDALAVIGDGAVVEAGAWIGAGTSVGARAVIGAGTRLYPGVHVYAGCRIGQRGIVHSGAVIGADGFGFAPYKGRWIKIPQTGAVVIGDDVEIGANTTIDRGAVDDTVIEDGVKIDNLVQIAHNCRIGAHTVIAGCVGIAGSAVIGRDCQLGGAAMINGHLTIADGTVVAGGTFVSRSLNEAGFYTAVFPIMKNRDWERNAVLVRHLDEMRDRLRRLEAQARAGDGKA